MEQRILNLEKSLFKYKYTSDINYMNSIIDDDYEEIGKSGKKYNKKDITSELSSLDTDRKIDIYNYKCLNIDKNTWLIHYITLSDNKPIYRTSIWRRVDDELKIFFHQASEYKEQIELKQY